MCRRLAWAAAVFVLIAGCSAALPRPLSRSAPPRYRHRLVVATLRRPLSSRSGPSMTSLSSLVGQNHVDQVVGSLLPAIAPASPSARRVCGVTPPAIQAGSRRGHHGHQRRRYARSPIRRRVLRCHPTRVASEHVGGETVIDEIVWSSWTATEAHATATREFLDCTPSCAAGTVHPEPMTIDLSNPVGGVFRTLVTHVLDETQTTNDRPRGPRLARLHGCWTRLLACAAARGLRSENRGAAPPAAPSRWVGDRAEIRSSRHPATSVCAYSSYGTSFTAHINKYDFPLGPCDIERCAAYQSRAHW